MGIMPAPAPQLPASHPARSRLKLLPMAPSWIVRTILGFLVFEAGVCAAFLADYWPPLRDRESSFFRFFVEATRDEGEFILDPTPASSRMRLVRPLENGESGSYLRIDITDDPDRLFEANPPSATDWATILDSTRKTGIATVAIDHPLSWDNAGEIPLRLIDHQLSSFDRAVLCVDLRRSPNSQALPRYLKRNAIPLRNLKGNAADLPRVNRVSVPPSATGAPNVIYAFRILENEVRQDDDGTSQPAPRYAFAVWERALIPSFPVAVAMARFQVAPEDVRIELGHHIRLGDGPIIPIDAYGQLRAPLGPPPRFPFTTAESIETDPGTTATILAAGIPDCAVFIDSTSTAPVPWQGPARLLRTSSTIDTLPRPGPADPHPRFPVAFELLIFALLAGLAATFVTFTPFNRVIAFGLLALGSLVILAGILDLGPGNHWTTISPILVATLAGWILSFRMQHQLRRKTSLNVNVS